MQKNESIVENPFLVDLSHGPNQKVTTFQGYYVNGYKFHTVEYGSQKSTSNSGVCVNGSSDGIDSRDYYGQLVEVVVIPYPRLHDKKVILFKCEWFDPSPLGTSVHPHFPLVSNNHTRRYNKYEPFIQATQASQVFYCPYPSKKTNRKCWWEATKIKARPIVEVPAIISTLSQPFQEDELHEPHIPTLDDEPIHIRESGVNIELPHSSEEDDETMEEGILSSDSEDIDSDE